MFWHKEDVWKCNIFFAFECGFLFQTNIQLSKVQSADSIYFSFSSPEVQQVLCLHQRLIHKHDLQKCKFLSRHSFCWLGGSGDTFIATKKTKKTKKHKFRLLSFQIRTIKRRRPLSWPSNKLNMSAGRAPSLQFLIWSGLKKKTKKNKQTTISVFPKFNSSVVWSVKSPEASSGCRRDSTLSETSLFLVSGPCEAAKMQSQLFHFDLSQRKWTACRITKFVWTHLYSQEGTETQSCALQ